jgi:hypothetical protein
MESFLNLLWVVISLGSLAVWRAYWLRERGLGQREPVREWAAVVCALVLLFFAVSLSDDLRSSVLVLEESAGAGRHLTLGNAKHSAPDAPQHLDPHSTALRPGLFFAAPGSSFVALTISEDRNSASLESGFRSGRAPPYSSL